MTLPSAQTEHWSTAYPRRGKNVNQSAATTPAVAVTTTETEPTLDDELAAMRKKRDLLRLKAEVRAMELELIRDNYQPAVQSQPRRINFMDVEETLQPFSGDNAHGVRKWLGAFEELMAPMAHNEMDKILVAKRRTSGTARLFVRSMESATTWTVFKQRY